MTTAGDARPDPHNDPEPTEADALPPEEDIDPVKVDEQLETEPDEAENYTDNYAPDPGEDT
jgi:hypothetical protein